MKQVVRVVGLVGLVACSAPQDSTVSVEHGLYDCNDPGQRFTCAGPSDPDQRFICHATGSAKNPYVKISVPVTNPAHVAGVAHGNKPADQDPGASANDLGGPDALDCECNVRTCADECTGAADGTACDDHDLCTTDGTCAAGVCQPGAPRCTAGTSVDACNTESGACDPATGACAIQPEPAGTSCGASSQCDPGGVCVAVDVRINEAESSGGSPGDWVEIVNHGAYPVDLSGWRFLDNDDAHTPYVIPAGTTLAPGPYLVLDEAQFGFGLGAADSARLFDSAGALIDAQSWATHAATTYGRCPDTTGAFRTTTSPTKGAANDCTITVRVNEVESSGGVPGDWVELYNATPIAVDISGYVFKDNDDTHGYALPAGSTLAPGALLVLDEAQFGFGLGSADAARLFDTGGTLVDAYAWTTHATTTYGRCPNGSGAFATTSSPTKGAPNDCSAVRINEIESSGGVPGDWVELVNAGSSPADLSGWIFRDNDDTHAYVLPAGTTLAPNAYLVLDEASFGFGLGAADSARIFNAGGALVDSYAWTSHASVTYGRCPNATGPFASTTAATKGGANSCDPSSTNTPWPGSQSVTVLAPGFGGNLSGIFHDGSSLWAVQNAPSKLWHLNLDATAISQAQLRYPDGTGSPDAEDLTLADGAFYVATERDNEAGTVSRPSILRFDASSGTATHEWNLAADLPALGPNLGLEAITFVSDATLVARGFFDETKGHAYNPSEYANHGSGLFFVGVEQTGTIYAYALDHAAGTFARVATIVTGDPVSKAVHFDGTNLWQHCGAPCGGQTRLLAINATGRFTTFRIFDRPSGMPNLANEGLALGPCTGTTRDVFWADDSETDGHAVRRGDVACVIP